MKVKIKHNEKDQSLLAMRHSTEHVLTQAMLKLYPGIKMAMGPATDEGFYFDFDPSTGHSTLRTESSGSNPKSSGQAPSTASAKGGQLEQVYKITEEDFPKIEEEMKVIIKKDLPIKPETISIEKAKKLFQGNEYKLEW